MNAKLQRKLTRVWIGQKRRQREYDFEKGQRGRPIVLQDVDTNAATVIDIHMVNTEGKLSEKRPRQVAK